MCVDCQAHLVLHLLAHRVVERPAVFGATTIVLAVRADEEERVIDGRARSVELEADQVVVPLELEPAE